MEGGPSLSDAADEWLSYVAACRAPGTLIVYRAYINGFVAHAGGSTLVSSLSVSAITSWIASLYPGRKRNTIVTYTAACRSFLLWCYRQGWMARDLTRLFDPPRAEQGVRWSASTDVIGRLLAACDFQGIPGELSSLPAELSSLQDRALLLLLYGCGLRVSEAVALRWEDIDWEGSRARIHGKGSKQRWVGLGETVTATLRDVGQLTRFQRDPGSLGVPGATGAPFIAGRPVSHHSVADRDQSTIVGDALTTLRPTHSNGAIAPTTPLLGLTTASGARYRLARLAARAGVGHVTPHQLRHSFAHAMLDSRNNILELRDQLGHERVETTMLYLREREREAAVEAMRRASPADRLGAS